MTLNIEQRTETAVTKYEKASSLVDSLSNTDSVVKTPVGPRSSFPKLSRELEEDNVRRESEFQIDQNAREASFNADQSRREVEHQSSQLARQKDFQERFSVSQQALPWSSGIEIADEFQRYHVGTLGQDSYKEFLPNPEKLPFTTSADISTDISKGYWLENGLPSKSHVKRVNDSQTSMVTGVGRIISGTIEALNSGNIEVDNHKAVQVEDYPAAGDNSIYIMFGQPVSGNIQQLDITNGLIYFVGVSEPAKIIAIEISLSKISDLRFLHGTRGSLALIHGCKLPGDGGEGVFKYDPDLALDSDDGVVCGNWIRVLDGDVKYSYYGLPSGGDDMQTLAKVHKTANALHLPVKSGKKMTLVIDSPTIAEVKTIVDFTGCTFEIRNGIGIEPPFNILESDDKQPVTVDPVVVAQLQSQLTEKAFKLPALKGHKALRNCLLSIESDQLLSNRVSGGTITPYYRESHVFHKRSGNLIGHILCDMTSGNLTVTAKPIEDTWLTFGNVKISNKVTVEGKKFSFVRTHRLLTIFHNITCLAGDNISVGDISSSLIQGNKFAFVVLKDIFGESFVSGVGNSSYVLSFARGVKLDFDNVNANSGWGVTNTNWIQEWTVKDSFINRLDNHHGIGNAHFENTTLTIHNIIIGYGVGMIKAVDCTFVEGDNEYNPDDNKPMALGLVNLRAGYQLGYRGEIQIIRPTIKISGNYPSVAARNYISGVDFNRQNFADSNASLPLYLPNVLVENPHIDISGSLSGQLEFAAAILWDEYKYNDKIYLPSRIRLKNPTSNHESELLIFKVLKGITTDLSASNIVEKTCRLEGIGVKNNVDDINFNSIDIDKYADWQFSKSLFDWTLAGYNQDASRVSFVLDLDHCKGSVFSNGKKTKLYASHSEIVRVRTATSAVSEDVSKLSMCTVWPNFRLSGGGYYEWFFSEPHQKLLMENCEVVPADLNGEAVKSVVSRERQRLIHCYTKVEAPIDQNGVNNLWQSLETSDDMYKKPSI